MATQEITEPCAMYIGESPHFQHVWYSNKHGGLVHCEGVPEDPAVVRRRQIEQLAAILEDYTRDEIIEVVTLSGWNGVLA